MQTLKKFWNWLVVSSADPAKISLTVKGFLLGLIPMAMVFLNLAHIQTSSTELTQVTDTIVGVVQSALVVVSGIAFVYGFLRKIYYSVTGTNSAQ